MTRVGRPTGLIRYDSLAGLSGRFTRWIRPRTVVYGILLAVGIAVASLAFSTVKPANFLVYRMSGAAYFVSRTDVRNQFMVRIVNKRSIPATFQLHLEGLPSDVRQTGFAAPVTIAALAEQVSPLVLVVDRASYTGPFKFTVKVQDDARTFTLAREIEFLGPDARLLREEEEEQRARPPEQGGRP